MTWIRKMTENGLDYKNPTGAEAYAVFKNLRIIERNTSEGSRAPEKVSFPRPNRDLPDSNSSLHSRSRNKKGRVLMMISALKSSQHSTIRNGIRLTWSFLVLLEITSMNWTHVQSPFLWVLLRDGIRWIKASCVILKGKLSDLLLFKAQIHLRAKLRTGLEDQSSVICMCIAYPPDLTPLSVRMSISFLERDCNCIVFSSDLTFKEGQTWFTFYAL